MHRTRRLLGALMMAVLLLVGVGWLALGWGASALGHRAVVIEGDALAPEISPRSLAFSHPVAVRDLTIGDLVQVEVDGRDRQWRVSDVAEVGTQGGVGIWNVAVTGDGARGEDVLLGADAEVDRIGAHLPWLGAISRWLSSASGLAISALFAATGAALSTRFRVRSESAAAPASGPGVVPASGAGKRRADVPVDHLGTAAETPESERGHLQR